MKKEATISLINNNEKKTNKIKINIVNDKIKYKEEQTDVLFYKDKNLLIRDNKDMYMEYDFNKQLGNIYVKDLGKNVNIDLKVNKIINNDNCIDIEYRIEDELYRYIINME